MKSHVINRRKLQQELEKSQRLEESISYKLETINKVKFSFSQELIDRIKELLDSGELKKIFTERNDLYSDPVYLSEICSFRHCVVKAINLDEEELKRQYKINRKRKGLIAFLLRFVNFKQYKSSVFRKFILRFNFKNMSDESGSDNNIVVFKDNLYYSLIPIINEKSRQRILY